MQFCRSEVQMGLQGSVPPGGSAGRTHFLSFPAYRGSPTSFGSWPCIPVTSVSVILSFNDSGPPVQHLRCPLWLHWAQQDNLEKFPHLKILNVSTSAKSLLPCSQFLGVRAWTSSGAIILANSHHHRVQGNQFIIEKMDK